jgi:hypothetical protein
LPKERRYEININHPIAKIIINQGFKTFLKIRVFYGQTGKEPKPGSSPDDIISESGKKRVLERGINAPANDGHPVTFQ